MSQIGQRGEKICSGKAISNGQMDRGVERRPNRQTDHYRVPTKQGPNNHKGCDFKLLSNVEINCEINKINKLWINVPALQYITKKEWQFNFYHFDKQTIYNVLCDENILDSKYSAMSCIPTFFLKVRPLPLNLLKVVVLMYPKFE